MRKCYIYKIVNLINNKIYIGQSVNYKKRWKRHRWCAKYSEKHKDNNTILYNAIRKYGIKNFKFEVIETIETDDIQILNNKEMYWISHYNSLSPNGYNMTLGGQGSLGMSDEVRLKISIANKGRKLSKEHIEQMRQSKIGLKQSKESNEKRSETLKGRIFSEKHLEKIGKGLSDIIIQYTLENVELRRFVGYKEAVNWLNKNIGCNCHRTSIQRCIHGRAKSCHGYKWGIIAKRDRVSTIENFNKSK